MQSGGKTVALKSFKLIVKIDKFKILKLSHRKFLVRVAFETKSYNRDLIASSSLLDTFI